MQISIKRWGVFVYTCGSAVVFNSEIENVTTWKCFVAYVAFTALQQNTKYTLAESHAGGTPVGT